MSRQLSLPLAVDRDFATEPFLITACNAQAASDVMDWRRWPVGALALVGPAGSGKSHLAAKWAAEVGDSGVVVENAEAFDDPEGLFHLLNRAQAHETAVLLTSRQRPSVWSAGIPDLRSRLNALPVAELSEPDDALLHDLLVSLFAQRFINLPPDLIRYIVTRMERSFSAAATLVGKIDGIAAEERIEISRALARRVLEAETRPGFLFESEQ